MPFCDKATAPEQDGPNRPKGGAVFAGQTSLPASIFSFCCFRPGRDVEASRPAMFISMD